MSRHIERTLIRASAATALILTLSACDGLPALGAGEASSSDASAEGETAPGILRIEEREVERPDVYSASARGLWDGRFSLGGRWVAVEEEVEAERVRITNTENGRVIEGALFPREFDLPGPPIMVSMDAATALGMEAGSPAELKVVVLRTETVEIPAPPPPPEPEPEPEPETEPAAEAAQEGTAATAPAAGIETGGVATSALNAAPAAATAPAASALSRPRIQVAGGANKSGAEGVAKRLAAAKIPASVSETTASGKPFFRVLAGPFSAKSDLDAALAAIRKLGYSDAFPVK